MYGSAQADVRAIAKPAAAGEGCARGEGCNLTAQMALDGRNVYLRLSGYDDSLRCDLLAKLPLRTRRWDGRRWIVRRDQVETLQAILAAHGVVCCWQKGGRTW